MRYLRWILIFILLWAPVSRTQTETSYLLAPVSRPVPALTLNSFCRKVMAQPQGPRSIQLLVLPSLTPETVGPLISVLYLHPELKVAIWEWPFSLEGDSMIEYGIPLKYHSQFFPIKTFRNSLEYSLNTLLDYFDLGKNESVVFAESENQLPLFQVRGIYRFWVGKKIPAKVPNRFGIISENGSKGIRRFLKTYRKLLNNPQSYVMEIRQRWDQFDEGLVSGEEMALLIQQALERHPGHPDLLEFGMHWFLKNEQDSLAISLIEEALEKPKNQMNQKIRSLYVIALAFSGEYLEALSEVKRMKNDFGPSEQVKNIEAFFLKKVNSRLDRLWRYKPGHLNAEMAGRTEELFHELSLIYPKSPGIAEKLIKISWRRGKNYDALREAGHAYRRFPDRLNIKKLYIRLLIAAGNFNQARIVLFETARNGFPDSYRYPLERLLFETLADVIDYLKKNNPGSYGKNKEWLNKNLEMTSRVLLDLDRKLSRSQKKKFDEYDEVLFEAEEVAAAQTRPEFRRYRLPRDRDFNKKVLLGLEWWEQMRYLEVPPEEFEERKSLSQEIYNLRKAEQWEQAWKVLRIARKRFPADSSYPYNEIKILIGLKRYEEAALSAQRLLIKMPRSEKAKELYDRAQALADFHKKPGLTLTTMLVSLHIKFNRLHDSSL